MSECIHKEVVTFRTEAGEPVPLWACSKCKTRFEPIGPWMEREKSLQARIDALEKAAETYSDNGHFPDCAANEWTRADCTCGLAELEALLQEPTK